MDAYDVEPTPADLAAIEAEWPVIEAELGILDAEIAALTAAGGPSALDWRRLRRAQRRLLATSGLVGSVPRSGKSFAARRLAAAETLPFVTGTRDGAA
jgi:hypothetical protein